MINGYVPIYKYNACFKIAGNEISIKRYEKYQLKGYSRKPSVGGMTNEAVEKYYSKSNNTDSEKRIRFHKSVMRARENIFDIIACNIGVHTDNFDKQHKPKFVTLTFAEEVRDIKAANKEYMLFIKRLNDQLFGKEAGAVLKYICIPELQARGVWHYHILFFNLPLIPVNMKVAYKLLKRKKINNLMNLQDIWQKGYVFINAITNEQRAAAYVTKYLTKGIDIIDGKADYGKDKLENDGLKRMGDYDLYKSLGLENMKRYQASRGLKRAVKRYAYIEDMAFDAIIDDYKINGHLDKLNKEGEQIRYYQYQNEHRGNIFMYNFRVLPEHKEMFKLMVAALCSLNKHRKKQYIPKTNRPAETPFEHLGVIKHHYVEKAKLLTKNVEYSKLYIS